MRKNHKIKWRVWGNQKQNQRIPWWPGTCHAPQQQSNIHQNHPEKNGQGSWVSSGVTVSYSKTTYIAAWRMKRNARSLSFTGPTEKLSCTNTFSPALNKPLTARGRPATAAILPSEQEMKSWRRQQEQRMAGSTEEWKTAEMDRRAKERKGLGKERARGGDVLTLISLRMTSIMLPITMRKSKTFQGSLK